MILIVAEHAGETLKPITGELVAAARRLAGELHLPVAAAVLGSGAGAVVDAVRELGVERIFQVDDPRLSAYSPDGYVGALDQVIASVSPHLVLAGHTSTGYDFMPRLAAALAKPVVAGCVSCDMEGDRLVFTRHIFNAKLEMRLAPKGDPPYLVTIAPGAFPVDDPEAEPAGDAGSPPAEVEEIPVDFSGIPNRSRIVETRQAAEGSVDLSQAPVIVAAGRGVKSADNLGLIYELADALGAAVGASRPVVDAEWMPREHQIGSSGQTVSPKLYVAVGISGAVQHLVGMQSSRCIVAINKDPDAPIFKVAHYGIADDLFKVLPEITKTVRALKGGG